MTIDRYILTLAHIPVVLFCVFLPFFLFFFFLSRSAIANNYDMLADDGNDAKGDRERTAAVVDATLLVCVCVFLTTIKKDMCEKKSIFVK